MALTWKGRRLENGLRHEVAKRGVLRSFLSPKPSWGCVNLACIGYALEK